MRNSETAPQIRDKTEQPLRLQTVGDDVHSAAQRRPRIRGQHAGEHLERRGLPCPARPQQPHDHARRDFERQLIDGGLGAKSLGESLDGDHGR